MKSFDLSLSLNVFGSSVGFSSVHFCFLVMVTVLDAWCLMPIAIAFVVANVIVAVVFLSLSLYSCGGF